MSTPSCLSSSTEIYHPLPLLHLLRALSALGGREVTRPVTKITVSRPTEKRSGDVVCPVKCSGERTPISSIDSDISQFTRSVSVDCPRHCPHFSHSTLLHEVPPPPPPNSPPLPGHGHGGSQGQPQGGRHEQDQPQEEDRQALRQLQFLGR